MNRKDFLKLCGIATMGIVSIPIMSMTKPLSVFASTKKEHEEEEYNVYLPNERPFGISMEEWTHRYWRWYLSFDKNLNNINKDSGINIMTHQPPNSPMFFIPSAGSYEEEYEPQLVRRLKISHNQGLFFNVLATIVDMTDLPQIGEFYKRITDKPMPSAIYKNRSTNGQLHLMAKLDMDYTKSAFVTLNGEGLPYYRIHSSKPFSIEYAVDNIPDYKPGSTMAVQDGFWVFIKPLPIGHYNIQIRSEGTHVGMHNPEDSYRKDIMNEIEVI